MPGLVPGFFFAKKAGCCGTTSGIWCFSGFFRVPFWVRKPTSAGFVYAKPASSNGLPQQARPKRVALRNRKHRRFLQNVPQQPALFGRIKAGGRL